MFRRTGSEKAAACEEEEDDVVADDVVALMSTVLTINRGGYRSSARIGGSEDADNCTSANLLCTRADQVDTMRFSFAMTHLAHNAAAASSWFVKMERVRVP